MTKYKIKYRREFDYEKGKFEKQYTVIEYPDKGFNRIQTSIIPLLIISIGTWMISTLIGMSITLISIFSLILLWNKNEYEQGTYPTRKQAENFIKYLKEEEK